MSGLCCVITLLSWGWGVRVDKAISETDASLTSQSLCSNSPIHTWQYHDIVY